MRCTPPSPVLLRVPRPWVCKRASFLFGLLFVLLCVLCGELSSPQWIRRVPHLWSVRARVFLRHTENLQLTTENFVVNRQLTTCVPPSTPPTSALPTFSTHTPPPTQSLPPRTPSRTTTQTRATP